MSKSKGIFISIQEMADLYGYTYEHAQVRHAQIRDALNPMIKGTKKKWLTIKEFCDYENLNLDEIKTIIHSSRNH